MRLLRQARGLTLMLAVSSLLGLGCQTYDFETVDPLAIAQTTQPSEVFTEVLKPNLMLVVDTSGSMNELIDPNAPACRVNGQICDPDSTTKPCPANCATRMTDMKAAMGDFLTRFGSVARMGMVHYPRNGECAVPTVADIDVPLPDVNAKDDDAQLSAHSAQINSLLQTFTAKNSTPTKLTVQMLAGYGPLADEQNRQSFLLVLTDGLPNCANGQKAGSSDRQGAVDAVRNLREQHNVKTIVVGFGSDLTSGEGPATLQAMAEAGAFSTTFFQASNKDELATALGDIAARVNKTACRVVLETEPSSPDLLSVVINGEAVPSGADSWTYAVGDPDPDDGVAASQPVVTFHGALCEKLQKATQDNPAKIEIRIVQVL